MEIWISLIYHFVIEHKSYTRVLCNSSGNQCLWIDIRHLPHLHHWRINVRLHSAHLDSNPMNESHAIPFEANILVLHGTRDWLRDLQFVRGEEFILSDVAIDRSSVTYDQAPLNGIIINGFARQAAQLDRSFHGHSFTEEYHKNSIAHLQQSR